MDPPIAISAVPPGLICPSCEYDLTGLLERRCPECGRAFDADELRRNPIVPPRVAFERAGGWGKLVGLAVTWLTVLAAWPVFAAQVTRRGELRHAGIFALACFGATPLSLLFGAEWEFIVTWLATAAVYLVLQTLWLSLVAPTGRGGMGGNLRAWLVVGLYTSAVVPTEISNAPPIITLTGLARAAGLSGVGSPWSRSLMENNYADLAWAQLLVWLAGVAACVEARYRARRLPWSASLPLALLVGLTLLVLYAATIEHVGARIYELLD